MNTAPSQSDRTSRRSFASTLLLLALVAATLPLPSCRHWYYPGKKPVSLSITVVDSKNAVWQGLTVRILEAWNEWSDDYRQGKDPWATMRTDDRGLAYFDSEDIASADLGFLESPDGIAVLYDDPWRNEAVFIVEVGDDTLGWIEVEIPVRYPSTHLDVEIEFEP
ncbi:MAG: hypothetical protein KDC95_04310 [Planctomycetes bacterium]|nr:hypothetical protein [Planctomycetota bacterium]